MKKFLLYICLTVFIVPSTFSQEQQATGEVQVLKQQIQILYQQFSRVVQELNYLSNFVENNVALNVSIPTVDMAVKGEPNAPVTLIEFSDYQCPYCSVFALQSAPEIDSLFVEAGLVRKVFFDFPIPSLHPHAVAAAEAARCAGEQGKYWEMHDQLFSDQQGLADLSTFAEAASLDMTAFNTCIESDRYDVAIAASMQEAESYGVRSTPTIALGYTRPDGSVQVMKFIRGTTSDYAAAIQALLDQMN